MLISLQCKPWKRQSLPLLSISSESSSPPLQCKANSEFQLNTSSKPVSKKTYRPHSSIAHIQVGIGRIATWTNDRRASYLSKLPRRPIQGAFQNLNHHSHSETIEELRNVSKAIWRRSTDGVVDFPNIYYNSAPDSDTLFNTAVISLSYYFFGDLDFFGNHQYFSLPSFSLVMESQTVFSVISIE